MDGGLKCHSTSLDISVFDVGSKCKSLSSQQLNQPADTTKKSLCYCLRGENAVKANDASITCMDSMSKLCTCQERESCLKARLLISAVCLVFNQLMLNLVLCANLLVRS